MSLTIASQPNQLLYVAPKIEMKNKNGTKQGVCVCVCVFGRIKGERLTEKDMVFVTVGKVSKRVCTNRFVSTNYG